MMLMAHKKDVRQCKFNDVDESRLDHWASGGYATYRYEGGLNDPKQMREMWVHAEGRFHAVSHEEKRT